MIQKSSSDIFIFSYGASEKFIMDNNFYFILEQMSSESESDVFCLSSLSDDDELGWSHSWPQTAWNCFMKGKNAHRFFKIKTSIELIMLSLLNMRRVHHCNT